MSKYHGQSEYTQAKQQQLIALLNACQFAWGKDRTWAYKTRLFVDCMAGSGYTDDGCPGSPIILQDFSELLPDSACVWCDINKDHVQRLAELQRGRTDLLTGRYQERVRTWLEGFIEQNGIGRNNHLMGLIYLDDNGCREIWNDDGFMAWAMQQFPYMDLVVHFSETAWRRANGAGYDWTSCQSVLDMLRMIFSHKPESVVFAPKNKQHWRMVYGVKSAKMRLLGSTREKLRDYVSRLEIEQTCLFN